MLRYLFLAGCLLLSIDAVFSQVLYIPLYQPIDVHAYRQIDHLPKWAKSFADTTLKKVLVVEGSTLVTDPAPVERNLPPGMRPVDYIGRDGLPGDPLPAVHQRPLPNVIWEKMRQYDVDDNMLRERMRQLLLDDK
jgi:hypothetical protein